MSTTRSTPWTGNSGRGRRWRRATRSPTTVVTWRIRLREGLRFHDGEPVRAQDCAASLARWSKRDPFGQLWRAAVEAWRAADDRTLEIRLNRPFPLLLDALRQARRQRGLHHARAPGRDRCRSRRSARWSGSRPVPLPERRVRLGQPRGLCASSTATCRGRSRRTGLRAARSRISPRIEWHILPDPATAAAALQSGEVDWVEQPLPDLHARCSRRNRNITLEVPNPAGFMACMRLQPPAAARSTTSRRRAAPWRWP